MLGCSVLMTHSPFSTSKIRSLWITLHWNRIRSTSTTSLHRPQPWLNLYTRSVLLRTQRRDSTPWLLHELSFHYFLKVPNRPIRVKKLIRGSMVMKLMLKRRWGKWSDRDQTSSSALWWDVACKAYQSPICPWPIYSLYQRLVGIYRGFEEESEMEIHLRCHVNNTVAFQCCFCDFKTSSNIYWFPLKEHIIAKHAGFIKPSFSCDICGLCPRFRWPTGSSDGALHLLLHFNRVVLRLTKINCSKDYFHATRLTLWLAWG